MEPIAVQVIEDGSAFMGIVARFLEDSHSGEVVLVAQARRFEESLTLAAEEKPDAILLDLDTPGVSGLDLIRRLRVILPNAAIIALTRREPVWHKRTAYLLGADWWVHKPDFGRDLMPTIRRVVRDAKPRHPEAERGRHGGEIDVHHVVRRARGEPVHRYFCVILA